MQTMNPSSKLRREGEAGMTLVEISVAMCIFTILVVSVLMTLTRGIVHRRESFETYLAMQALRDQIAGAQETANAPPDPVAQQGIGSLFGLLGGIIQSLPLLNSGQVQSTVYSNEPTVPLLLAGPQDLNFDGDALDDLGNLSAGTDMKLVPITFSVSYDERGTTLTMTEHRLIAQTTD